MMTDEDTPVRMSVQDIALMREIVRWRRNRKTAGGLLRIEFVRREVYGAPYWVDHATGREVWYQREHMFPMAIRRARRGGAESIPAQSLTEAVDLLVAYGFLPLRFSSAYRAGWHAADVWASPDDNEGEWRRLFHDPDNISFPAGGWEA